MAGPISITTGALALGTFAYGACQSLFQAIEAFHDQSKDISHLKGDIESLKTVLNQLFSALSEPTADNDADLAGLKPHCLGVVKPARIWKCYKGGVPSILTGKGPVSEIAQC